MRHLSPFRARTVSPFQMLGDLETFFKDFETGLPTGRDSLWFAPALDLEETEIEIRMTVDLPGMKKDDIKVEFHEGVLTVSGERSTERTEKGHYERSYGKFTRKVSLPSSVNDAAVEAKYEDGVLRITMPKQEKERKKTISIA